MTHYYCQPSPFRLDKILARILLRESVFLIDDVKKEVLIMNIEKLTNRSREALLSAQSIAQENGNPELNTLHLLKAMLDQDDSLAASLLKRSDIPLTRVAGKVENAIEKLPKVSGGSRQLYQSGEFSEVLNSAAKKAESMHDEYISIEHFILALIDSSSGAMTLFRIVWAFAPV